MSENHLMCVYKLISPSGKIYIGQARDFDKRMKEHGNTWDGCPKLGKAVQKYGWENFTKKVLLENLTVDEMNFLEEFCISVFDSIDNGYNITIGGYGVRGENGRNVNYGSGKYGVTKDDLSLWRKKVYENNREKISAQQKASYQKHREKRVAQKRAYWDENRENLNLKRKIEYEKDGEKIRERNRDYYTENKEKIHAYNESYYENNKEKIKKRINDILEGCFMMFPNVENKDDFRRIFMSMFGGGRTRTRRTSKKHQGFGFVNEWDNWLFPI